MHLILHASSDLNNFPTTPHQSIFERASIQVDFFTSCLRFEEEAGGCEWEAGRYCF
jgi:hypothetical protein